jgi:hypothetical protein
MPQPAKTAHELLADELLNHQRHAANAWTSTVAANHCNCVVDCPQDQPCPDADDQTDDCQGHPCGCTPEPVQIEEAKVHATLALASAVIAQALAVLVAAGH